MFVIYTRSTNSGAFIFYLEHLFFIKERECCVAACCFGSVKVFAENIMLDPVTCIRLAEDLGCGNINLHIWAVHSGNFSLAVTIQFKASGNVA